MLTEEEKKCYEKNIKMYNKFSKYTILMMFIPVGFLIYKIAISTTNESRDYLSVTDIITLGFFFVVIYVGYMSFRIKADILKDILEGCREKPDEKESKAEAKDQLAANKPGNAK